MNKLPVAGDILVINKGRPDEAYFLMLPTQMEHFVHTLQITGKDLGPNECRYRGGPRLSVVLGGDGFEVATDKEIRLLAQDGKMICQLLDRK